MVYFLLTHVYGNEMLCDIFMIMTWWPQFYAINEGDQYMWYMMYMLFDCILIINLKLSLEGYDYKFITTCMWCHVNVIINTLKL